MALQILLTVLVRHWTVDLAESQIKNTKAKPHKGNKNIDTNDKDEANENIEMTDKDQRDKNTFPNDKDKDDQIEVNKAKTPKKIYNRQKGKDRQQKE